MTARKSMASSPLLAFKASKPEIPYVTGLEIVVTAHNPPLPDPRWTYHTSRTAREHLVATPLERCLSNPPAEVSDKPIPNKDCVSIGPLSQTEDSAAILVPASQIAETTSDNAREGENPHAASKYSDKVCPCRILLKITSQIRVRDGGNAQVVLAHVLSVEGSPNSQWQLPVGDTVEVVAKFYDPLYADHQDSGADPFAATDNDYRTEVAAYHRLQPLQGKTIPRFYGSYTAEVSVDFERLLPGMQDMTPARATASRKSRRKGTKKPMIPSPTQIEVGTTCSGVRTRLVRLIILQEIINADHLTGITQPRTLRMPRRRLILSSVLTAWETMYYTYGLYYRSLHPTNVLQAEFQGEGVQYMTPRKKKKKKKSKNTGGVPMGVVFIDFTNVSLGPSWPLWRFARDESWWKEFLDDWSWLWLSDWPWEEWMASRYGDVSIEARRIGTWVPFHHSEKGNDDNFKGTPLITKDSLRNGGSSSSYGRPSIDADGFEVSFAMNRDMSVVTNVDATVLVTGQERLEHEKDTLISSKPSDLNSVERLRVGGRFIKGPERKDMTTKTGKRKRGRPPACPGSNMEASSATEGMDADGDFPMIDAAETWGRSSDEEYESAMDDEDEGDSEGL